MATNHKSRAAILAAAKTVISEVGSYQANMIDIAARAEVSRATVYNHFTDKAEMFRDLLESEIHRLAILARSAPTPADALYELSQAISRDTALRQMAQSDPADIVQLISQGEHALWNLVRTSLTELFGAQSALVLHWLLGQIASPLSQAASRAQADHLVFAL
jgi:AcrR family transcriptional regulator